MLRREERPDRRRPVRPCHAVDSTSAAQEPLKSRHGATLERMTAVEWLDAMSPWPRDGFGLERMRALLGELGDPQDAYPAIHVVGTNGKSTATVTIEQLLLSEGLAVGSTISPHVATLERADPRDGEEADFEAAVARVRAAAEAARRDAVRDRHRGRAGSLRGRASRRRRRRGRPRRPLRRDERAANARRAPHERRARAHGRPRRHARGDRDREARRRAAATRSSFFPTTRTPTSSPVATIRIGGAREAAEAFARPRDRASTPHVSLPGRFERRDGEIRDGAHNPDGARHLVEQLDRDDYTVVASDPRRQGRRRDARHASSRGSSLRRHDARPRLALFPRPTSPSSRARHFDHVEVVDDPVAAVARAHELGEPVLVTGSLYLLGDLAQAEQRAAWRG